MKRDIETYAVAELRRGKTRFFVDFEPRSPYGGPISIWQREDNGNSCGVAHGPEGVEDNQYLMGILEQTQTTWLLEVCRGKHTSTDLLAAFMAEFQERNGRPPERKQ